MLGYGGAIVNENIHAVTESPVTTSSKTVPIFAVELFDLSSGSRCLMFPSEDHVVRSTVFTILVFLQSLKSLLKLVVELTHMHGKLLETTIVRLEARDQQV